MVWECISAYKLYNHSKDAILALITFHKSYTLAALHMPGIIVRNDLWHVAHMSVHVQKHDYKIINSKNVLANMD